jgi:hypothetical protein
MAYELRFQDGTVQDVDERRGLNPEQLAALNQGLARLVAVDATGGEVVLAEVQAHGEVLIVAGLPSQST